MFIQPLISCVMLSPEFGLVLGGIGLLFPLSSVLFPDREDLSRKLSPPVIAGIMFAFTMVSKVNAIPWHSLFSYSGIAGRGFYSL